MGNHKGGSCVAVPFATCKDCFSVRMLLSVTKDNCTLTIIWPASCCGELNHEELKFIVVVDDVESCYRIVTTPLSAESLVLRVAIPPYFSSSASSLVVTVHLCHALFNEAGWRTVESLTSYAAASDCEEFDWQHQMDSEHGPTGITSRYNL